MMSYVNQRPELWQLFIDVIDVELYILLRKRSFELNISSNLKEWDRYRAALTAFLKEISFLSHADCCNNRMVYSAIGCRKGYVAATIQKHMDIYIRPE